MTIRVGAIGAGVMGAEHARLLREEARGATLAAVCDADLSRAKAASRSGATLVNQQNWVPRFTEAYRRQMVALVRFAKTGINEGATAWDGYVATALAEQLVPALGTRDTIIFKLAKRPQGTKS